MTCSGWRRIDWARVLSPEVLGGVRLSAGFQLSWFYEGLERRGLWRERCPAAREGERRQSPSRKLAVQRSSLRLGPNKADRQFLDRGLVSDQQDRGYRAVHRSQPGEELGGGRGVEAVFDQGLDGAAEAGRDALECLPGSRRGGTEDERRGDLVAAQVLGDELAGTVAARGERPVAVRERGIVPTRLRVA